MKLVVGLGNPGSQYNFTRHNFGFLALDFYLKVKKINWNTKPRYGATWVKDGDVIFVKPQDFYNESGKAVREFVKFYKYFYFLLIIILAGGIIVLVML